MAVILGYLATYNVPAHRPSKQNHATYHTVQIVESYRDRGKSKHPNTRVLANLGEVDKLTDRDVDNIINGLFKVLGRPTFEDPAWEDARDFAHVFALVGIWKHLKIGTILKQKTKKTGQSFDLKTHIRLMTINALEKANAFIQDIRLLWSFYYRIRKGLYKNKKSKTLSADVFYWRFWKTDLMGIAATGSHQCDSF